MKKIRSFRKIGSGMKRFEKGGLADYEREPDAQDRAQQEGAMAAYRKRKEDEETLSKPLAKASFKEAFREARSLFKSLKENVSDWWWGVGNYRPGVAVATRAQTKLEMGVPLSATEQKNLFMLVESILNSTTEIFLL